MAQKSSKTPVKPLLTLPSTANEWRRSSAFYSRITVARACGLTRPSKDFRHARQGVIAQWGASGLQCSNYLRKQFLDLGNVQNQEELGKLNLKIQKFSFFIFRI